MVDLVLWRSEVIMRSGKKTVSSASTTINMKHSGAKSILSGRYTLFINFWISQSPSANPPLKFTLFVVQEAVVQSIYQFTEGTYILTSSFFVPWHACSMWVIGCWNCHSCVTNYSKLQFMESYRKIIDVLYQLWWQNLRFAYFSNPYVHFVIDHQWANL